MNDVSVYCVSPGPWQVVALPNLASATEDDRAFFLRASRVVDMDSPEKVRSSCEPVRVFEVSGCHVAASQVLPRQPRVVPSPQELHVMHQYQYVCQRGHAPQVACLRWNPWELRFNDISSHVADALVELFASSASRSARAAEAVLGAAASCLAGCRPWGAPEKARPVQVMDRIVPAVVSLVAGPAQQWPTVAVLALQCLAAAQALTWDSHWMVAARAVDATETLLGVHGREHEDVAVAGLRVLVGMCTSLETVRAVQRGLTVDTVRGLRTHHAESASICRGADDLLCWLTMDGDGDLEQVRL
jgi:hypothetical protein